MMSPLPVSSKIRRLAGSRRGAGSWLGCLLPLGLLLQACGTVPPAPQMPRQLVPEVRDALAEKAVVAAPELPAAVEKDLSASASGAWNGMDTAPTEPRFDLNVVQLPASQVFATLARDTRYSVIVDPELKTMITVALKDVTLIEALATLREIYGFEYKVDGTRIFVRPATLETRVFEVNYPNENRDGRSDIRVQSTSLGTAAAGASGSAAGTANGQTSAPGNGSPAQNQVRDSSRISTATRNDLWEEVQASLHLMIPQADAKVPGRQLIISPQSGVIVVRAFPAELRQVENYLRSMKLSIERQIILEAKIIEVDLNSGTQTGVNWSAFHTGGGAQLATGMVTPNATLTNNGAISDSLLSVTPGTAISTSTNAASPLFGVAFQTGRFAALMDFLETQGKVQVLSSPRIAAMNNQQAVLKVGNEDFYVTNVSTNISSGTTTGGAAVVTPSITVQPFFSGVALDVTPSIDENGAVILHVHPSVSNVTQKNLLVNLGTLGNFTLPLASSSVSETDTVVGVHDGNIVAIGGLMRVNASDSNAGLPGAADLPGLGYLFASKSKTLSKQELVILIKPTIVHPDASTQAERDDLKAALEHDFSAAR